MAQAAASGARGIEAAVLVVDHGRVDAEGASAVRDLGGVGVPVYSSMRRERSPAAGVLTCATVRHW